MYSLEIRWLKQDFVFIMKSFFGLRMSVNLLTWVTASEAKLSTNHCRIDLRKLLQENN